MTAFAYEAVDAAGKRLHGTLEAPDSATLTRTLEGQGLLVLEVADTTEARAGPARRHRIGQRREVLELTRALASLLAAGMPLARALSAAGNVTSGQLTDTVAAIRSRVERGESLAGSLAQRRGLFSPVYVGMVRAGEKSGHLVDAFRQLTEQLEREEQLRAKLLSASIYPMLLATLGGLAVVVLLVFVIPRFGELLEGTGAALPRSTAIVLAISAGLRNLWPLLAGVTFVGVGSAVWLLRGERGRRLATATLLRLPLIRPLMRNTLAAQFARMTGTLLSGGAPLLVALDDAAESLTDPVARDETVRIRTRTREGASLHSTIRESALFPELLGQLVAVGEESSQLAAFLLKAADIFENKTDRAMQRLVVVLEPAMIVVFGGVVALVALALLQAIYGVNAEAFR